MADLSRMAVSAGSEDLLRHQIMQMAPIATQAEGSITPEAVREAAPPQQEEQDAPLTQEEQQNLESSIEQLDDLLKPLSIGLNVQRIESLSRFYVELLDRETGEVIREIPGRKIIELQENLRAMQGLLFDKFS
ncbi:MAG: hypothetical protein CVV27_14985 [Candidatus Melainabacteria bacterium HGW-Melainabacteria-1]|nr:MAG: hypothetical protein CVV27_14985 [Candidatus Melainabacteria bacterium HGW-Melainabacteria-1]